MNRIFGNSKGGQSTPPNFEKVTDVLTEFCIKNPSDKKNSGNAKAQVKLTRFVQQQGSAVRNRAKVALKMWDCATPKSALSERPPPTADPC